MMVTIFRQPGKTGTGNFEAEKTASGFNGNSYHSTSDERKIKMKLNSVIFCLCAGVCSSAMIENAFSMNEDNKSTNRFVKLDSYHAMIVSKHFTSEADFQNLETVAKKHIGLHERFHHNPISITPDQLHLWPNLETLHLYTHKDIVTWKKAPNDIYRLHKIEVWPHISCTYALLALKQLNRLINEEGGSLVGVTFHNVMLKDPNTLGNFDEDGTYRFNKNVYTNDEQKNANFVITSIDDEAFYGCRRLASITIPDSVTFISNSAFAKCTRLSSITIPDSVQSIDKYAFNECAGLTSITIPDSVQSICKNAFTECENAKFIVPYRSMRKHLSSTSCIDESLIDVSEPRDRINEWIWAEDGDITIPYGTTSINGLMFKDRKDIKSITIPNSVSSIGYKAFSACESLKSITIPDSVTDIRTAAFAKCTDLTSITISKNIQSIDCNTFEWCDGLTSITIPNNVTFIAEFAFMGCKGMTSVTIPDRVQCIDYGAFCVCEGLRSVTIPNSVQWIDEYAFAQCIELKSITIPDSVTYIGNGAFERCAGLTSIVIPDSVTFIGMDLFAECYNLNKIYVYSGRVKQLIIDSKSGIDHNVIEIIEKPENKQK